MKTAGIVAEYNPFHMGHRYHIEKTRELTGADYVVVVMSGDFVQRGEPACTDKYFRTRMALMGGADLVIEIPVFYATSSAEAFAGAGVYLLEQLNCVDYLSFGSEWAELSDYLPYVILFSEEGEAYKSLLKSYLKAGDSYPVARSKAAAEILADTRGDRFLKEPNHILGIEYLKALSRMKSNIEPVVVNRKGAGYHNEQLQEKDYSSATAIREALAGSAVDLLQSASFKNALGDNADAFIAHILAGETVCWDDLMPLLDYEMLMGDGWEDQGRNTVQDQADEEEEFSDYNSEFFRHIRKHYISGCSFDELINVLHTKNRTDTALKRGLLHILLRGGMFQELSYPRYTHLPEVSYARVLGFSKRARPLLKELQTRSRIPLIQRPARYQTVFGQSHIFRLDIKAAQLYEQIAARKSGRATISELTRQQTIVE